MVLRAIALTLGCGLAVPLVCETLAAGQRTGPTRVALDSVFAAYVGGDLDVVTRTFARSRDFQTARVADPGHLNRRLATWHRGKSVMLLELAEASVRVGPQYTRILLDAGRQYVRPTREGNEPPGAGASFVRLWHRTAIGLLHRAGDPARTEEYVESLTAPLAGSDRPSLDPRLTLAVAIAQEHRCWFTRPGLDLADAPIVEFTQAAGVRVNDPEGPPPLEKARRAIAHRDCLRLAIARFTEAAAFDETRAEARLRAGWLLFQAGHFQESLDRLDVGDVGEDRDLAYWAAIFRGRALTALDRHAESVDAYRSALALFPDAQSAGVGLALALFRVDRLAEADEFARTLRARPSPADDPWPKYVEGDARFVDGWIRQLRASIR
jgi:hypothetical protein